MVNLARSNLANRVLHWAVAASTSLSFYSRFQRSSAHRRAELARLPNPGRASDVKQSGFACSPARTDRLGLVYLPVSFVSLQLSLQLWAVDLASALPLKAPGLAGLLSTFE